jgi:hypothetical protein
MLPSQLQLGRSFVFRTLIISAILASLFAAGCGTSYTAQPAPTQAPTITQQPTNQTVAAGGAATFTASASGNPAPTVQWQVSVSGGAFSDITGATSTTLTLSPVTLAQNGSQYHAVFTNSVASVNSNSATLTVTGAQSPTITSAISATFTVGMAGTFTVMATGTPAPTLSESGTLPSGVTFTPATGVLAGMPLAGTGAAYPITFTAHNGAGADATQSFTLNVNEGPSFASPNMTNFTVGAPGTFTIIAAGFPAPTFSETGALPNGVTLTTTGLLSGTPTISGTFPILITASNGVAPSATQNFTLTVDTAPVITSANNSTFTVGTPGTFTVTATGSPAPTLSESGTLPAGVTFDPATGLLSGTPRAGTGAIYAIIFAASNGSGADATQNFTLTVDEAPAFTSAISTTFTAGGAGTFTVTASGFPAATFSETGALPGGVTLNSSTGVLSGTPAAGSAGSYLLMLTASNGVGTNATQSFTLTVNPAPPVIGDALPSSPIFAGGSAVTIPVTVANDVAGDVLTASLTADSNTGAACTTTTCGTVGPVTFVSLGNYTLSYTPPASLAAQVVPTLVISSSSNPSGSFASTDYIEVDPAGALLVKLSGGGIVQVGVARSLTATVYNDAAGNPGVTIAPLTASGYACSTLATNSCGTLVVGTKTSSGTTTTTPITYTPPTSLPSAPYDRPRVQATSVASPAQLASTSFLIAGTAPPNTGLRISTGEKFNSALAATGAAAPTVDANIANDTGNLRTVTWSLTYQQSPGSFVACPPPTCGTLSTATPTGNGAFVSSNITYTPPSTAPSGNQATPTITATSVDNSSATDSFTFNISDGTCSTGHESVLNGQYAFLLRGGGANAGYTSLIGSFNANGAGGITGGLLDSNASIGPATGFTILSTGSSYKVGLDNRVCLTLANSGGGVQTFRASLGTLVAGVATQGRIIRSEDNTGRRPRQSGVLMKQDPTSFGATHISGNYAFGEVGVDSNGGRFAGAGVFTATAPTSDTGTGMLNNFSTDFDDAGTVSGNVTVGSGTYTMAANGRGTATTTLTILGKAQTSNLVLYMVSSSVSSSEVLFMTTGNPNTEAILSGEMKKQTGPFSTAALSGNGFVFYTSGVNPGNAGGNVTAVGQATFTSAIGNATVTIDENNNGTLKSNPSSSATFAVDATGRMTVLSGLGSTPPIIYLIDSNSGFSVGTDNGVPFGYVERQSGSSFTTSSISGSFFFGGDSPTTGAQYQSGTAIFNSPLNGTSSINGKADDSGPNGLKTENISGGYSFSGSSTPPGKGTVGTNSIAYAISTTKLVFMSTGADPEIFVGQK